MQHGITDLGKRRPLFSVCPKTHAGRAPAVACGSPSGICRRQIMSRVVYTIAIERLYRTTVEKVHRRASCYYMDVHISVANQMLDQRRHLDACDTTGTCNYHMQRALTRRR